MRGSARFGAWLLAWIAAGAAVRCGGSSQVAARLTRGEAISASSVESSDPTQLPGSRVSLRLPSGVTRIGAAPHFQAPGFSVRIEEKTLNSMNFEMEAVAYVGTVAERIAQAGVRPLRRESVTGCPTCFTYVAGPDASGRVRGGIVLISNPAAAHVWIETFEDSLDALREVVRSVSLDHTATLSPRLVYGIELSSPLVSVDQPSYPPLEIGENGVLRSWVELDGDGAVEQQVRRAILLATGATSVSFRTDSSGPRPRTIASVASREGGALELEYVVDEARKLVEIRTPMATD